MVGQQGSAARGRPLGQGFTRPTKHQMYSRCGTSGEGPHDWRTMRRDLAAFPAPVPAAFCPYSVVLTPGVTLVEASAGTGKTTALTALVARLVVDPEARVIDDAAGLPDLRRALAVTFTNAATAELVTRVRRTLRAAAAAFAEDADPDAATGPVRELLARWGQTPEARATSRTRLAAALASGEASVFTIDGFLKRVLERSAFESGEPFAFSVADSDADLRRRALAETWQARVRQAPELAAVAVAGGAPWSLARLDAALVDILRHPGTRIVPEPEPLAEAVARYRAAVAGLAAVWNEAEATALLDGAPLTKSAPADPAGLFGRVSAFVARGGAAHVDAVLAAGSARLADGVHKSQGKAARAEILGHAAFGACDAVAEAAEALRLAVLGDAVVAVDAARRRLGARAGTLTFDDLLSRVHDALHHARIGPVLARAIRGQYRVALVDEFQDTNARQDAVFRRAFAGAPLVLVGDPKQAVYAFRGADVFAYLGARRHAAQTFTLGRNYRSAPALVGAVNALFGRGAAGDGAAGGARPFVHDGIPFVPAEAAVAQTRIRGARAACGSAAPFVWWSTAGLPQGRTGQTVKAVATPACVAAVVAEIRRLVDDPAVEVCETVGGADVWRRLRAADVAVLVATNRQAGLVQNALRRAGLPSVVGKGGDVRTAPEMADLEHVLRAVDAPGNRAAVRTALATELWGWDDARIAALDEAAWADLTDALRTVRALWQRRGVFQAVTAWAEAQGVLARLLARPDGERRATNLRHALELAHDAEGQGARSADRLLRWIRTRHTQPAMGGTTEMRLESDDHAVQVATMHGCKGLQYRVVFAPFLWEGREKATWHGSFSELAPPRPHVPTDGGGTEIVYDVGSPDVEHHRGLADAERLAEHLRLTYVALTRAEDRAYVVWGPLSGAHASGLGHLLHGHATPHTGCDSAFVRAARSAANAALPGTVAALRSWIDRDGLAERMVVEALPDAAPRPSAAPAPEAEAPRGDARTLSRDAAERIATPTRRTSFSGWTSGAPRDERVDDDRAEGLDADAAPVGMAAFASGAAAGTGLHAVLQTAVFHDPDAYLDAQSPASQALARTLRLHGLADGRARSGGRPVHRAPIADVPAVVRDLVSRLARTRIPGLGFRLQDVPADPQRRDTEWRFVVPLRHVRPATIADVFREHGDSRLQACAERVARLTAREADGLLVGTADFVAEVPGPDGRPRVAVFDWKSNWLGPTPAHYGAAAMEAAMDAHHYRVQSHLYLLGLHRHLQARLGADYDYDRDVAGVAYVFLRGVPDTVTDGEPATGFDVDKPSRALIEALDAALLVPTRP